MVDPMSSTALRTNIPLGTFLHPLDMLDSWAGLRSLAGAKKVDSQLASIRDRVRLAGGTRAPDVAAQRYRRQCSAQVLGGHRAGCRSQPNTPPRT